MRSRSGIIVVVGIRRGECFYSIMLVYHLFGLVFFRFCSTGRVWQIESKRFVLHISPIFLNIRAVSRAIFIWSSVRFSIDIKYMYC